MEMKAPYYIVRATMKIGELSEITEHNYQSLDGAKHSYDENCKWYESRGKAGAVELLKAKVSTRGCRFLTLLESFELQRSGVALRQKNY